MELHYYTGNGQWRIKRRYLYAFWAGLAGFCAGAAVMFLLT